MTSQTTNTLQQCLYHCSNLGPSGSKTTPPCIACSVFTQTWGQLHGLMCIVFQGLWVWFICFWTSELVGTGSCYYTSAVLLLFVTLRLSSPVRTCYGVEGWLGLLNACSSGGGGIHGAGIPSLGLWLQPRRRQSCGPWSLPFSSFPASAVGPRGLPILPSPCHTPLSPSIYVHSIM